MLNVNQSQANFTIELQYQGLLAVVLFSIVSTLPCCVFLFINGTMLFTLRSKAVFRETSRYVLLNNLLVADTVLLVHAQLMYVLSICRVKLMYPVCGTFTMLASLTMVISPLTLVVMCLERYVAVCYPLRHATIFTIRNTEVAIFVIWTFSSLSILTQVLLLLDFSFEELQMKDFCSRQSMLLNVMSVLYNKAYTGCLFVAVGVAVTSSYIGVMVAARSASTDKASARKARNTLLLHLVQLGLTLSSTVYSSLLFSVTKSLDRITTLYIQAVFYVCIIILPRCLSTLIYGLRDQTIRPILMYNLCCLRKCSLSVSVVPTLIK